MSRSQRKQHAAQHHTLDIQRFMREFREFAVTPFTPADTLALIRHREAQEEGQDPLGFWSDDDAPMLVCLECKESGNASDFPMGSVICMECLSEKNIAARAKVAS